MEKTGVCPIRSRDILEFALNALRERGAFPCLPEEAYREEAKALEALLPDRLLPEVYMDVPLMGGAFSGMAAVLDCYERCYLDYNSGGEYFRRTGLPAMKAPENRDDLLVFRSGEGGVEWFTMNRKLSPLEAVFAPGCPDGDVARIPGIGLLKGLPLRYRKEAAEGGFRLILTTGNLLPKKRFSQKKHRGTVLEFLAKAGCDAAALGALERASFNCGVPFLHPKDGYKEWIACMDVAAFALTVRGGEIADCRAVIRICDKSVTYALRAIRLTQAYQWHITDNCDQRCRHCYLFAEDARLKCVTTPWDQLMHTLEEITADAEKRYAMVMPAISGGDPILHPEFWRFAEELHRRGMRWLIMGNPFHLNDEVCTRLYRLGCYSYQMSLDGLEPFHDSMRKPGSYRATLNALSTLKNAGIETQLMATASRRNLEDILACMDVAVEYGADSFVFARYCATSPDKVEEYPTPEQYRDFLYRYEQKARDYRAKKCKTAFREKEHLFTLMKYEMGEFEPSAYSKEHPELVFDGCHLGQTCAILANGDIMACRRMESVIGNVKTDHIWDVLESDLCMRYRDIRNIKKCRDCELLQYCRGCRAVGFNATGDLQAADPCCWK